MEPKFPSEEYKTWFYSHFPAGAAWTPSGVDLVAPNAADNEVVQFEQLNDFFLTIDAPHLREGNIQSIFNAGFTTPESVITMTLGEMSALLGKASGKKVFDGLRSKLKDIPAPVLMGAYPGFGRGVGTRKFKKLYDAFAGDMSKCMDENAILAVPGFQQKTAKKIVDGYSRFCDFLEAVDGFVTIAEYIAPASGNLSGKSYVFTGFRDPQLEQRIAAAGGKVSTSVSKNTAAVIAADPDETSGKLDKARANGVQIIARTDADQIFDA